MPMIDTVLKRLIKDPERPVLQNEQGRIFAPQTVRKTAHASGRGWQACPQRDADNAWLFHDGYGWLTAVVPLRRELPGDSPGRFPGSETLAEAIAAVDPDFRPFLEGKTWWVEAGETEDGQPILMACDFYMVTRALAFEQFQDALELLEEEDEEESETIPMWVWGSFSMPAPN